ncbi:MAG: M14 family metallopeptidase [Fusobacterium varium]|uniref:M14 family metallopeptidase n=1 Tax=Fusobacterium varium TaxID=856 RepID=UPI002430005B|nr:M14 family metallopeptidase [Fusobacterium varium]UYI78732.1 MAG: M14 family metallopeptidase [Fusobacterium varium]
MSFILGNIKCENGKKEKGYWNIEKTNYHIPITIICGKQEGKTIVISSGVHSCEYVGIQAAIETAQELSPNNISGTVIILHPVNYTGFFKRLPAVMPEDNKNLNRVFPGNKDGTLSEKIAYSFSKNLYPNIDFFFDLHGGDVQENVMPFVYFSGSADENIKEISIEAAKSLSVPYRVKSSSVNGVYSSAAMQGVPSLLVERGGRGLWSKEEVTAYKQDIKNLLKHFHILENNSNSSVSSQKEINNSKYLESKHNGFWYPAFQAGDTFKKGAFLGEIKDCFGNILETYKAEFDGIILYETISLAIAIDDPLIAYGEI